MFITNQFINKAHVIKYTNGLVKSNSIHTQKRLNLKSFRNWYQSLWERPINDPPYNHITQIGDPVLRQKAEFVPKDYITSNKIYLVIKQMIYVLRKYDCVGLAAPQIGVPLRIIIMEFSEKIKKEIPPEIYKLKCMETLPLTVIINPEMKILNYNTTSFLESCESVRGYTAEVDRFEKVQLIGFTPKYENIAITLRGWNARIAQHELDHLDGVIYTDKMNKLSFACTCWYDVNLKGGRIEIPFYPK